MVKLYRYVGPEAIRRRTGGAPSGWAVESVKDLLSWAISTGQEPNQEGAVAVTFVVDEQGCLLVADRSSEHVACAGGRPVQSAGELFLLLTSSGAEVVDVTNQSTGFCPEPESWPAVANALDRMGIGHPGRFTSEIVFRQCPGCGQQNIVKDGGFVCGVCGAELPRAWNF